MTKSITNALVGMRSAVIETDGSGPEGWVDDTRTASRTAPLGEYTAQWWAHVGLPDDPERRTLAQPARAGDAAAAQHS